MTAAPPDAPADSAPDQGWTVRRKARLRAALQVMADRQDPISVADLQDEVAQRVPLLPHDESLTKTGHVRAWVNLGWFLSGFNNSGWVHRTYEGLRITRQGREALAAYPDAESLLEAHRKLHIAWDERRKTAPPERDADPTTDVLHPGDSASHALRAAESLLSAWRAEGSVLSPGRPVWSPATTETLRQYLSAAPQPVPKTMPGLEDDARVLASEALALLLLPFRDLDGVNRRWEMRDALLLHSDPPGLPWELSADLEHGMVTGGKRLAPEPLALVRELMVVLHRWWASPAEQRESAWADPWVFRDLVRGEADRLELVPSLLCLVTHPQAFTVLVRSDDREAVLSALGDDPELQPSGDLEKDLRDLTLLLQQREGRRAVDYYQAPYVQRWRGEEQGQSAWLIRGEVDQQNRVPSWLQQGIVTITVGRLTTLPTEPSQGNLGKLVDDLYVDMQVVKREAKKRDVVSFVLALQPGDLVATVDGPALRIGTVLEGAAERVSLGGSTVLRRRVSWQVAELGLKELPTAVRSRLRFTGADVVNLTEVLAQLEAVLDTEVREDENEDEDGDITPVEPVDDVTEVPRAEPQAPATLSCDTVALAEDLHHTDSSWLDELIVSLNERRQVVLEGPPGTGKTYLVQKLLDACGVLEGQRAIVQFHPTYAYEDFVEGWRPTDDTEGAGARLAVKPGPLKRLAEDAAQSPGKAHVLVIDEINRANIAKVFGELYFLLEYRDADIELLYSDGKERFRLPENLFVIGTMNTADRSIALLDAAMRRRFVFLSMDTTEPALAGVLRRWCEASGVPVGVAELLDKVNASMQRHGLEEALAFGPSYFMRARIGDVAVMRRVWRRELLPMLREHHYDQREQVDAWYPFERWLTDTGLTSPVAAPAFGEALDTSGEAPPSLNAGTAEAAPGA